MRNSGAALPKGSLRLAPNRWPFGTRLVPGCGGPAGLGVLEGGRDRLLTVQEVAAQLRLSTATVYGLCASGALPHVRLLNAIRIAPWDLQAFIDAHRQGR